MTPDSSVLRSSRFEHASRKGSDGTMSFGDHLEELRKRILLACVIPLPLFILFFPFSNSILGLLMTPCLQVLEAHGATPAMLALSPTEVLMSKLKVSLLCAIVLSIPWIFYHVWKFVAPGLYEHERRFAHFLVPLSTVLTGAGVFLLYYVMLPLILHVLVAIGMDFEITVDHASRPTEVQAVVDSVQDIPVLTHQPALLEDGMIWILAPKMTLHIAARGEDGMVTVHPVLPQYEGHVEQSYRLSWLISFVIMLLFGISVAFQLPLVVLLMGWMGLVRVSWLRTNRRYALFVCGFLAAVTTPADAASMIMMLIPLYILYELGILLLVFAPAERVAAGRVFRRNATGSGVDAPEQAPGTISRESEDDEHEENS